VIYKGATLGAVENWHKRQNKALIKALLDLRELPFMETQLQDKRLFILEGNIGAGKSTLLKILKETLNIDIIDEPIDKWQNVDGQENLLDLFYKDTKRWAYTFQSYAFISRVQAIFDSSKRPGSSPTQILERSVFSDRFCFAKNAYEAGLMSDLEWQIYKDWFEWLVGSYMPKPQGFIYLRTTPHVSHARLTKRNRHEESSVALDYMEALHKKHEDWLIHKVEQPAYIAHIPVLALECDHDFEKDRNELDRHVALIKSFIETGVSPLSEVASLKQVAI
jgi:deoxyadenosine/deoxycytidine kinase